MADNNTNSLFQIVDPNSSDEVIALLKTICARMEESERRYEALRLDVQGHLAREAETAETIKRAFPDGDAIAHRHAHEAMIREHEENTAFWREMRMTLKKGGFIAALVLLIALLLAGTWFAITNSKLFLAILGAVRGV